MPAEAVSATPVPLKYVYCDSPAKYASAVWSLRAESYLILDCEGYNLGRAGGCVTLICVGSPFAEHIFLFDLLSPIISQHDIYPLLQLLCDPSILKVVWDGRMDYLEIFTTYGVALDGVLDLQVAEVVSRSSIRGKGEKDRIARLPKSYLYSRNSEQYRDLYAVIGLQRCWTDCGYAKEVGKDREYRAFLRWSMTYFLLKPKLCKCIRIKDAICGGYVLSLSSFCSTLLRTFSSLASSTHTSGVAAGFRKILHNTNISFAKVNGTYLPIESRANPTRQMLSAPAV